MYTSNGLGLELTFTWTFPVNGIPVHPTRQFSITELKVTAVVETTVELAPGGTVDITDNGATANSMQENRIRV
ncbi:MAG TPA: hypothetical protein VK503_07905 [Candidatus Bathyarchaeia archaeon]|nr:hypothetical protein [Candidatus Bathyarchaeia archaeon]